MSEGLFSHIKTAPREVEEQIINEFVKKYGTDFPHIRRKHYEVFVRGVVDNMFSREGIKNWMSEAVHHLTPERLEGIIEDPYFMLRESHLDEFAGYVPLARWTEAEETQSSLIDTFGERVGNLMYSAHVSMGFG